jgi:serine/threonine protein kinase
MASPVAERDPTSESNDELEALLIEVLDGAETRGVLALEEACERRPEFSSGLRRRWRELERMGLLTDQPAPEIPERLGEFRIVRRLGGGGMGVVYLAIQESLGREVALKLVRPDQMLLSGARERFLREVQVIARLQHPGIVPIYTYGKANGIAYFAMERVRGASLEQVLGLLRGREPASLTARDMGRAVVAALDEAERDVALDEWLYTGTWEDACLKVFRLAAEALEHVHARKILHRDLKPSNIMLTPEGRVMLLDFGLARGSGDERLTRSQAQLGSLYYYPPELLEGGATNIDERSDVYSLGVGLYQALCLQLPFDAGSAPATVVAISHGDPAPPRRHNPSLSWEAETVCLSAIESERPRRYASAERFARDLANVLSRLPIEARRAGAWLRTRRWIERHPARAVGLGLGALLLVAGPLGWALKQRQSQRELQAAYTRSERNFSSALQAVGHVLRDTAVEELEDVPRMQKARLVAIDRALELFRELERDRSDDPRLLDERAALRAARGKVLRDLGRPAEALVEFRAEIADRRVLLTDDDSTARRTGLAKALHATGKACKAVERAAEGVALFDESVALRRSVVADQPLDGDSRHDLAAALVDRSETLRSVEREADARRDLEEANGLVLELRRERPNDPDFVGLAGRIEDDFAWLLNNSDDPAGAIEHAENALTARLTASALAPERRFFAFEVASAYWTLALCLSQVQRSTEADAHLDEASRILETLLRDFPESFRYRDLRSQVEEVRGMNQVYAGHPELGLPFLERAANEREALCLEHPDRCDLALSAGRILVNLASALGAIGTDSARVVEAAERCERLMPPCMTEGAASSNAREMLAAALHPKIVAYCRLGHIDAARTEIGRRGELISASAWEQRLLSDEWNEVYLALRGKRAASEPRTDDESAAARETVAWLERAVASGYADVGELDSNPALDAFRDEAAFKALADRARAAARSQSDTDAASR